MRRKLDSENAPYDLFLREINALAVAWSRPEGVTTAELRQVLHDDFSHRDRAYRILGRLVDYGYFTTESAEADGTDGRPPRLYILSERGEERLEQEIQKLTSILEVVGLVVVPAIDTVE